MYLPPAQHKALCLALYSLLLVFMFVPVQSYAQQTINEIDAIVSQPQPRINIPGLNFTDPADIKVEVDNAGRNTYIRIPYIGEFISAAYKLGIILTGVAATIMIIVAGAQWVTSGGNVERITSAKNKIIGAVTGLIIAVTSYTLLYTINPDLVRFKDLRILYVQGDEFDGSEALGERTVNLASNEKPCGGAHGDTQTLYANLDGSLHQYASYSTKYGRTCDKKVNIKGIILHWTGGDFKASGYVKDWADPKSSGSICQIIVDKQGVAYQITNSLNEKVICQGRSGNTFNWNEGGIGIEIIGSDERDLTSSAVQKDAVIQLITNLLTTYNNIPKSNRVDALLSGEGGIFSHGQISRCQSRNRSSHKSDPGEAYMKEIIEAVGGTYIDYSNDARCDNP